MDQLPPTLQGGIIGTIIFAILFVGDRGISMWLKYRQGRLDTISKQVDVDKKVSDNENTEHAYFTSKYREMISTLETQMVEVNKRVDEAEKAHAIKFDALEAEHQQCQINSARQEERLNVQRERIVASEKRIAELELQLKGASK